MEECKNCNREHSERFCPNCGRATELRRINWSYITSEIGQVLNFERGIFFTIKELILRPGPSVHSFITSDRNRLVKPIIFLIVTSFVYSLVEQFFRVEETYVQIEAVEHKSVTILFQWVQGNYGYANLLMGVFIALWTRLFFRKYDYNFFEILILLCFTMGIGMLVFAIFITIEGMVDVHLIQFGGVLGIGYSAWAIGQFFDRSKVISYVKALCAYILGSISFYALVILIGIAIDALVQ